MGWAERAKESAKGFFQTEAGQAIEKTIRQKAEEEMDGVLGKKTDQEQAPTGGTDEDAAPDAPTDGEQP